MKDTNDDDLNGNLSNWGNFFPDEDDLDEFDPNPEYMRRAACALICLLSLGVAAVIVAVVLS
jgi:hypothetical protein